MNIFKRIKNAVENPENQAKALTVVETAGKLVLLSLAAIGAVFVLAVIEGAIEQKKDPEGFKKAWLEEIENELNEEARKEEGEPE